MNFIQKDNKGNELVQKRFHWETCPEACTDNIVAGEKYRFTVLTSCLIRMEYSESGVFENRPSQSVFYRNFPTTSFTSSCEEGVLKIETQDLLLVYQIDEPFAENTLSISLKREPASTWRFGEEFEDLGGTYQTLDHINGEIPLERGICSRYGFSVLDDSDTLVIGADDWVEVRVANTKDLYFFGYGYEYLEAIRDFYRLTGTPPMLPAYALGNWWSRYYEYTQQEYLDLMDRFSQEDIPFTVAIIDMDWHIVDIPKEERHEKYFRGCGWTGYSWNKKLFPEHKKFLEELEKRNLKTALNLHPSDGVGRHEDMYEEMCRAMGVDPNKKEIVPFDILNPKAMENYFDILLHPYEEDGVNFWWMDWQQGTSYGWIHEPNKDGIMQDEREKLDPLWMLNHLHVLDISRNGKRPMYFSRYSGPGSQRYSLGFSGDSHVTWESLDFQPYFTATSSNIGYCWWSHDIGGHMYGTRDDELVTRWIQLGVFSPINRLHSCKNQFLSKHPWEYPSEYGNVMKKYLQLRAELFPYLYTMNYRAHSEGKPMIWPMYYTHPKCSAAYEVKNQFWFGSEMIVSPITEPENKNNLLARTKVWLPKGLWFDFFNGTVYHSECGRKMDVYRSLKDYPVFAKAGAIIPQSVREEHSNHVELSETIRVSVFPGADNTFCMYEDEGEGFGYQNGCCAKTEFQLHYTDEKAVFKIASPQGDIDILPKKRAWQIQFRSFAREMEVAVTVGGMSIQPQITYDDKTATVIVTVDAEANDEIIVELTAQSLLRANTDAKKRCFQVLYNAQVDYEEKKRLYDIISRDDLTIHMKMCSIYSLIPNEYHLAKALKEQLTLEQDEKL